MTSQLKGKKLGEADMNNDTKDSLGNPTPPVMGTADEMQGVFHDFMRLLVRFLVVSWNMFMRIIMFFGIMPWFQKRPALFLVLGFLLLAFVLPLGVYFMAAGLVSFDSKNAGDSFIQRKNPLRKPDFQTDEEEREALQGEAMLKMLEAGHSTENAMKVHDAIGKLYDMKKSNC